MPYIPQKTPEQNQNQETKKETKDEEKTKNIPTILIPAPIFYNPMFKNPKNLYGKYQKKKTRPFIERQGDWVCKFCRNFKSFVVYFFEYRQGGAFGRHAV